MLKTRRFRRLFTIFAISIAAALLAAGVLAGRSESSKGLTEFSAVGEVRAVEVHGLRGGQVRLLANRGGRTFFVQERDGLTCYGRGGMTPEGRVIPGGLVCPLETAPFPSADRPVLPSMGIEMTKSSGRVTIRTLEGFAADGVVEAEAARLDSGALIADAPVTANTFQLPVRGIDFGGGVVLIARDSDGNDVFKQVFGPKSS